jgi:hypothetical protein
MARLFFSPWASQTFHPSNLLRCQQENKPINVIVENTYGILKVNIISLYFWHSTHFQPKTLRGEFFTPGMDFISHCAFSHFRRCFRVTRNDPLLPWIDDASGGDNPKQIFSFVILLSQQQLFVWYFIHASKLVKDAVAAIKVKNVYWLMEAEKSEYL